MELANVMEERKMMGVKDFFVGGDFNIEELEGLADLIGMVFMGLNPKEVEETSMDAKCGRCRTRVFRHSASLHARVIVDGAACRLEKLGDARDVLSFLGVVLVVQLCCVFLCSCRRKSE